MTSLLADVVLVAHCLLVVFIVAGLPLIWVGKVRRWGWVENRLFRVLHLAAIVTVAAESLLGVVCPLTAWEDALRGTRGYGEPGFVERWFGALIFYDCPAQIFEVTYVLFALAVAWTWRTVPPRR